MSIPASPQPNPPQPIIHHGKPPFPRRQLLAALGAMLAIFLLAFGIGLYRYRWQGRIARFLTAVVPYPAAIVDGRLVRYADYQANLAALRRFHEAERAQAPAGSVPPTEAELSARVLDRLVKDQLALALAERYRIVVTSDDVRAAYQNTILDPSAPGTASGRAKAEKEASETLERLYGLRPSEFKNRVLYPLLVRQRLERAIRDDEPLNAEKRRKAEAALADVKAGKPFREVAMAYSEESGAAATGGDRGMIGRGVLAPEVEAAAFALASGETSGVVQSALGYHVLKVTTREETGGKVARVRLQEILIRPIQLDDYLEAQKKAASIVVFVH